MGACVHNEPQLLSFSAAALHASREEGENVCVKCAKLIWHFLHDLSSSCSLLLHTVPPVLLLLSSSSSSSPVLLSVRFCRAAQLLTDREMRGGDAGWGHKQGRGGGGTGREREPSPSIHGNNTPIQRHREGHTETDTETLDWWWCSRKKSKKVESSPLSTRGIILTLTVKVEN